MTQMSAAKLTATEARVRSAVHLLMVGGVGERDGTEVVGDDEGLRVVMGVNFAPPAAYIYTWVGAAVVGAAVEGAGVAMALTTHSPRLTYLKTPLPLVNMEALTKVVIASVIFVGVSLGVACGKAQACSNWAMTTCFQLTSTSPSLCDMGDFILACVIFFFGGALLAVLMLVVWQFFAKLADPGKLVVDALGVPRGYALIIGTLALVLGIYLYGVFFLAFVVNFYFVGFAVLGGFIAFEVTLFVTLYRDTLPRLPRFNHVPYPKHYQRLG